jgi:hypothetical protein
MRRQNPDDLDFKVHGDKPQTFSGSYSQQAKNKTIAVKLKFRT